LCTYSSHTTRVHLPCVLVIRHIPRSPSYLPFLLYSPPFWFTSHDLCVLVHTRVRTVLVLCGCALWDGFSAGFYVLVPVYYGLVTTATSHHHLCGCYGYAFGFIPRPLGSYTFTVDDRGLRSVSPASSAVACGSRAPVGVVVTATVSHYRLLHVYSVTLRVPTQLPHVPLPTLFYTTITLHLPYHVWFPCRTRDFVGLTFVGSTVWFAATVWFSLPAPAIFFFARYILWLRFYIPSVMLVLATGVLSVRLPRFFSTGLSLVTVVHFHSSRCRSLFHG
jgi:hypothetical protein